MIGFHIDLNTAAFRPEYLKTHLDFLAGSGYDTVIWELEDYVRFDSVPEIAAPEALDKREFAEILAYSRDRGVRNIPLLQTLAHTEYFFRNGHCDALVDDPGERTLFCPLKSELEVFMDRLIGEYKELFADAGLIHLGCDEAWNLGRKCPRCRDFAEQHGKAALLAHHVEAMRRIAARHGLRSAIWADMALIHPEALELLSREITLFDWRYEIFRGADGIWIWDEKGGKLGSVEEMPPAARRRFEADLFPFGQEPCRAPEVFYTSDHLKRQGFVVVMCPTSACYMDTAYAGRHFMHVANCFDMLRHGRERLDGCVVTSWTVHLYPYELQRAAQRLPRWLKAHPAGTLYDYQCDFEREEFGLPGNGAFWRAAGRLSRRALLNFAGATGHDKTFRRVADEVIFQRIRAARENGVLRRELNQLRECLDEYRIARREFAELSRQAVRGGTILALWELAAAALATRAEAVLFLAEPLPDGELGPDCGRRDSLLAELRAEKALAAAWYGHAMLPGRAAEIVNILYGTLEYALEHAEDFRSRQ